MDWCRYFYAKITPRDQPFVEITTSNIVTSALREVSDRFQFCISEENNIKYYECIVHVVNPHPCVDTTYYKHRLLWSLELQDHLSVTVNTQKLSERQYNYKLTQIMIKIGQRILLENGPPGTVN
jgi:hypothetical protein